MDEIAKECEKYIKLCEEMKLDLQMIKLMEK